MDRNFSPWLWTNRTLSAFAFMRSITLVRWAPSVQESGRQALQRMSREEAVKLWENWLSWIKLNPASHLITQLSFSVLALPTCLHATAVPLCICVHRQSKSFIIYCGLVNLLMLFLCIINTSMIKSSFFEWMQGLCWQLVTPGSSREGLPWGLYATLVWGKEVWSIEFKKRPATW